jgi:hypothetical protein
MEYQSESPFATSPAEPEVENRQARIDEVLNLIESLVMDTESLRDLVDDLNLPFHLLIGQLLSAIKTAQRVIDRWVEAS